MLLKKMAAAAACLLLSAAVLTGCGTSEAQILWIGAGGQGGTYYNYATELSSYINKAHKELAPEARTTAGSAANLRLIGKNFLDMAIVQGDILESAVEGRGIYEEPQDLTGISAAAALYTEAVQIVVRSDAGISSVSDLKGKEVSVGEEESGVRQNATQILEANGLTTSDINIHYMSFADSADAMRSGSLDAFFVTAGAPTEAIEELAEDMSITLLSLDQTTMDILEGLYTSYVTVTIPAGTYTGQTEEVMTLGVKAVLVVSNAISDEVVKDVISTIFDKQSELHKLTPNESELTADFASSNIAIGFHSGAVSYYADKGISVAETDGELPTIQSGTQDD